MEEDKIDSGPGSPKGNTEKGGFAAVERILQVLSITFVLTYISGYLVTSTFLNSYGIAADTSEFLKARYLYVGFLYLLFLASVGMAFGFSFVLLHLARVLWATAPPIELGETPVEIKGKYIRVWTAAGFCFATSETVQITFLNPHIVRNFILLQTGLLASFLFYQLTNARALHHRGWDQHRSIFIMRGWTVFAMVIFATLPIVFLLWPQTPFRLAALIKNHKAGAAVVFNSLLLGAFCCALPFFYTGESLKRRLNPKEPKQQWWRGTGPKRTLCGALIIFAPANFILFTTYGWRWLMLQSVNLLLSATAMASVIFMSIAYTRDRAKNREELTSGQEWGIWLLRIATASTLYVASTIGYANVIYPLVPFAKSGGDFTTSSVVRVHFHYGETSDSTGRAPLNSSVDVNGTHISVATGSVSKTRGPNPSASEHESQPKDASGTTGVPPSADSCHPGISTTCEGLVILEELPDVVYFARIDDAISVIDGSHEGAACGPRLWRSGILSPNGPYRPHLIAVSRQNIVSIEETQAVSESSNCR